MDLEGVSWDDCPLKSDIIAQLMICVRITGRSTNGRRSSTQLWMNKGFGKRCPASLAGRCDEPRNYDAGGFLSIDGRPELTRIEMTAVSRVHPPVSTRNQSTIYSNVPSESGEQP